MDQTGIDYAVNLTPGYSGGGFEAAMIMSHMTGDRICNMVNIDWADVFDPALFAVVNELNLRRAKSLGAVGLKISKSLGLGIPLEDGKLLPVDDPRLDPIWKLAGELKLPVFIHTADPVAFFEPPTPSNERYGELQVHPDWSFSDPAYPRFIDLLKQLENIVARHPHTVFVGVHFGNYAENPEYVGRMLDRYPNYMIDTAARVPEFGRHDAAGMRDFFIRHQDRIIFGTDIGVSNTSLMLGSGDGAPKDEGDAKNFFDAHWRYFETSLKGIETPTPIQGDWRIDAISLPREVLEKLYSRNAARILGLPLTRGVQNR
jgi:predicted TIM-barrel fold metal-dependent hydrolase